MRSAMSRSNVDLPQPDGPISETNSPGATVRSTSTSASTRSALPALNTLPTPPISTAPPTPARLGDGHWPSGRERSISFVQPDDESRHRQPEDRRAEHRGVQLRRVAGDRLPVEQDELPDALVISDRDLRDDDTDDGGRAGEAQRRGDERGRRRQRSLISVFHHPAAYESISSTDSGAADFSPRSVPMATGKKARNAPRRQAAIHFWSPRSRLHEASDAHQRSAGRCR